MIAWLLPGALAGLVLALGPLLIHLLRRRQARRAIVPTVRFIPAVSPSSLRVRTPDDLLLLLLRTGAIAAAVLALAGPIFLTAKQRDSWDSRTMRAVVVDVSPSVSAERFAEIIATALEGGHTSRRIDSARLGAGLRRAAAWLATAPPGRREVVVISDFQHGSISEAEVSALPATFGLRFVRSAGTQLPGRIDSDYELFEGRVGRRAVTLDGWTTAMVVADDPTASPELRIEGAEPEEAARLERILRAGGVSWPRTAGTTVVRFGTAGRAPAEANASGPAAGPGLRLLRDPAVAEIPFSASFDRDTLVVSTTAAPSSYGAAILVQAAIGSWRDPDAHSEAEVQSLPDSVLQAWTRPAAPSDATAWRYAERSDARWFWLASLLCLAGEWRVRRRSSVAEAPHVRAA